MKSGAMQLKGAVYILPFTDEHYEFLQWLVVEIVEMKGEAALVRIEKIDTMDDAEIVDLFNRARRNEYAAIEKDLADIRMKLDNIKKGGEGPGNKTLESQLNKVMKGFEEIQRIDFFLTEEGVSLQERIHCMQKEQGSMAGAYSAGKHLNVISRKTVSDYQGKIWVTRRRPFVDRMASAWLIKRFIDAGAFFAFIDEKELASPKENSIAFDVYGGEFTHVGDLCTFEVLIKSFALKNKVLERIAAIVHQLDIKDEKYKTPEAAGLEEILTGIRKTEQHDSDALERGMQVFEMLYAAKITS
jgi:hypothetical protein